MPISEDLAWTIAREFADAVAMALGEHLRAVVVIGSLGGRTYRPGTSDIDTVVVVDDGSDASDEAAVEEIRKRTQSVHAVPKDFGVVLLRERELRPPFTPESEIVNEIIRLKRQGVVIHGELDLAAIPEPTESEIRESERLFYGWLRANYVETRPADERTTDAIVNTILLELRLFVRTATRDHVLDKRLMVDAFLAIPGMSAWQSRLQPIREYVTNGRMSLSLDELDGVLRDVSRFVQSQAALG